MTTTVPGTSLDVERGLLKIATGVESENIDVEMLGKDRMRDGLVFQAEAGRENKASRNQRPRRGQSRIEPLIFE